VIIEHRHRRPTSYATANSPSYCITLKTDQGSGIVNDPNGWFADPHDLVTAIKRIVYVSVESARIIDNLPAEITAE
jgi:hypothetical protein